MMVEIIVRLENCGTCHWWDQATRLTPEGIVQKTPEGACHGSPPALLLTGEWKLPFTPASFFCATWKSISYQTITLPAAEPAPAAKPKRVRKPPARK
jgi:hypothetical protein